MKYILLLLAFTGPANASCHRFAVWHYPWRQTCGNTIMRQRAAEDKTWYVEITKVPPDDPERERGLEELRELIPSGKY